MTAGPANPQDKPTPRRVLLTGGAGFIGSHLAEVLLARGDQITIVDDFSTGRRENLAAADPDDRCEVIEADLCDALPRLLATHRFDEIYHLAAAVGVDLIMTDPIRSIEVNIEQTAAVLRFAERLNGEATHPVPTLIASSSEVYGKPDHNVFSEGDDVVYGPTTTTRWSYAYSKAIDEFLALEYHRAGRAPTVAVRFFNTVGPRQLGRYGMVLPRFVESAAAGSPLRVFGDGSQSRCFCDVRDVAAALPELLSSPASQGRVFNLGSDRPITIAALAELVVSVLGSVSSVERIPYSDAYPEGFEDLKHRKPDLSRVRDAIGFEPSVTLEQTITDLAASLNTPSA